MLKEISINEIIIGTRLRTVDTDNVTKLCESIKKIGLTNNIVINQNNELLSGFHRYSALKELKYDKIACKVVETKSEDEKLLHEIDENLVRSELHYLDLAHQLKLKKEIYERLYPSTAHGKNTKDKSDEVSFVENVKHTLNKSEATIYRLVDLGKKFDKKSTRDKIKEVGLTQAECIKLSKVNDVKETLENLDFGLITPKDILPSKKSKQDLRPKIITPLITPIANNIDYTNKIKKVDMMEKINIEYYYGDSKEQGVKIIKNNDMLQYHYFAQDYKVLDTSSLICLITLEHNGLKEYIGFVSLNSPTINKKYRNQFFGSKFFEKMFSLYKDIKLLNMSRRVLLPSYRGIGLTKKLQNKIVTDLFNNSLPDFTDVLYVESNSILLHTMDFVDDSFNKTFLKLKDVFTEDEYKQYFKTPAPTEVNTTGYKEGATVVANTAFRFNEHYMYVLEEYLNKFYNIKLDDNQKKLLLGEATEIFKKENRDLLKSYLTTKKPLMLSNLLSTEDFENYEQTAA